VSPSLAFFLGVLAGWAFVGLVILLIYLEHKENDLTPRK
jgi:hypothetical protein